MRPLSLASKRCITNSRKLTGAATPAALSHAFFRSNVTRNKEYYYAAQFFRSLSTSSNMDKYPDNGMLYTFLGRTGLRVSRLSYGGWLTVGGSIKEVELTKQLMQTAWDAEAYAAGHSEVVFGKALKELGWARESYVISTKIYFGDGNSGPNDRGLSRKHIVEGMNKSLKRMGLDYVDVVLAHRPDHLTPLEEVVRAFNHVIDKGQAFYWGVSEWPAATIAAACEIANRLGMVGPMTEQSQYHLFHRDRVEREYHDIFKTYGIGEMIWSPLAGGVLTGKYNNGIPEDSRFATSFKSGADGLKSEEGKQKIEMVKKLTTIAEKLNSTVASLAIAWVLKNDNASNVILGATKVEQLKENLKALEVLPKLTPEIMKEIDSVTEAYVSKAPEGYMRK